MRLSHGLGRITVASQPKGNFTMKIFSGNPRKVIVCRAEVNAFRAKWPCCSLRDRSYWFEFATNGDLVDTDVPEQDDGPEAVALAQDAKEFLEAVALAPDAKDFLEGKEANHGKDQN